MSTTSQPAALARHQRIINVYTGHAGTILSLWDGYAEVIYDNGRRASGVVGAFAPHDACPASGDTAACSYCHQPIAYLGQGDVHPYAGWHHTCPADIMACQRVGAILPAPGSSRRIPPCGAA